MKTKVCFRYLEEHLEVAAVFPYEEWTKNTLACYCDFEGHSGCIANWVRACTRPATPEEYASTLRNLRKIGYDLEILPKMPRLAKRFYEE